MSLLVTAAEMRALDRETIDVVGVPGVVLMESAGRGVVDVIARHFDVAHARVVAFCGPGNNGGDGFVVARHLANRGADVIVALVGERDKIKGDARIHFDACAKSNVRVFAGRQGAAPSQRPRRRRHLRHGPSARRRRRRRRATPSRACARTAAPSSPSTCPRGSTPTRASSAPACAPITRSPSPSPSSASSAPRSRRSSARCTSSTSASPSGSRASAA